MQEVFKLHYCRYCALPLASDYINALDVSGSVNATGIVVGGPGTRTNGPMQIDCGTATLSNGTTTINFNFTFANAPKVVCNISADWQIALLPAIAVHTITTTSFKVNGMFSNTAGAFGWANGNAATWIAIG